MSASTRLLIIGVGNIYRGDDGAGVAVVRHLAGKVPAGVSVIEQSGEGCALMDAWEGAERVIIADAVQSGASPGMIVRIEAHAQQIPSDFFHYSSHAFSLAEAVEMARALERLPKRLIVYGIEGENFQSGTQMSPAVNAAVNAVCAQIEKECHAEIGS